MTRTRAAQGVLLVAMAWLAFLLLSLHQGWLNHFFFDTEHANVQGIDFFSVQRSWLNLLDGRSEFDTFTQNYGPYATWFIYHPALPLVFGPLMMAFSPWTAYGVWVGLSALLLMAAALILATQGRDPMRRALAALVLTGAFPVFLMLQSGNVHAIVVLSLALVFVGVHRLAERPSQRSGEGMLLAGLLISLFSKPFVLALLPLLLLVRQTRRAAQRACLLYAVVSVACLIVPGLNPVSLTWAARWHLLTRPEIVRQTMNVYTNGFTVTQPMQDNIMHWLTMESLTDFRLLHVDVYSLPVLLDGWLHTHTPAALYRVPILLMLEVSMLVACMADSKARLHATLDTLMAGSLLLFLSYGVVWEYQYTGVLPLVALLLVRYGRRSDKWLIALGLMNWLPSLYVVLRGRILTDAAAMTLLHAERVLPVLAMFVLLLARATHLALTHPAGLRLLKETALLSAESHAVEA